MWNRKQVKERGKFRFTQNYWKALLAGLVLSITIGGGSAISSRLPASNFSNTLDNIKVNAWDQDDIGGIDDIVDLLADNLDQDLSEERRDDIKQEFKESIASGVSSEKAFFEALEKIDGRLNFSLLLPMLGILAVIGVIMSLISICIRVFLLNPLQFGGQNFYLKNLTRNAELKELGLGFTGNYINVVKTMFLRDLYTFLWSLLFIIPGYIKSYEYRMIPYLLAENPDMDTNEAFSVSKKIMTGQKWNAFVLDLSFLGWYLLNMLTCGILGIFFVNPYKYQTDAALYEALNTDIPDAPQTDYAPYIEIE